MRRVLRPVLGIVLLALLGACGGGSGTQAAAGPRTMSYAGLGASDAVGIGASPLTNGYVYLLRDRLEGLPAQVAFVNAGISGARVRAILEQEVPRAIAAAPDLVTLWTGANDLVGGDDPDAFAALLDDVLEALTTETNADIFVADLPDLTLAPLFRTTPDPDVTAARVAAYNDRIAAVVAANGCVLVKLSEETLTDDMFWIDGFHPNDEGYELLADAFWAQILPTL